MFIYIYIALTAYSSSGMARMGQTVGKCDLTKCALDTVSITVKAVK